MQTIKSTISYAKFNSFNKLFYCNDLSIVENYYFSTPNFVHLNSIGWSCALSYLDPTIFWRTALQFSWLNLYCNGL